MVKGGCSICGLLMLILFQRYCQGNSDERSLCFFGDAQIVRKRTWLRCTHRNKCSTHGSKGRKTPVKVLNGTVHRHKEKGRPRVRPSIVCSAGNFFSVQCFFDDFSQDGCISASERSGFFQCFGIKANRNVLLPFLFPLFPSFFAKLS